MGMGALEARPVASLPAPLSASPRQPPNEAQASSPDPPVVDFRPPP